MIRANELWALRLERCGEGLAAQPCWDTLIELGFHNARFARDNPDYVDVALHCDAATFAFVALRDLFNDDSNASQIEAILAETIC